MTEEIQNSPAHQGERQIPVPVKLALEALKILEAEGGKVEGLNKQLPVFAMKLAESGSEVTVETLLTHARAGELNLKRTIPEKKTKTYAEIVAELLPKEEINHELDTLFNLAVEVKIKKDIDRQLAIAALKGNLDEVKMLVAQGADPAVNNNLFFEYAACNGRAEVVRYFVEECRITTPLAKRRAFITELCVLHHHDIAIYLTSIWDKNLYGKIYNKVFSLKKHILGRAALADQKQVVDEPLNTYQTVQKMIEAERHGRDDTVMAVSHLLGNKNLLQYTKERPEWDDTALAVSHLFVTEERVLQYLEKWGQMGKQPLHDIIYNIQLPKEKTPEMDLKAWGDAVLKCGPSMAKLVRFADRLPVPEKSADGKTWSMVRTRKKVAQFVYKCAPENPELAGLCMEHNIGEDAFNKALKLSKTFPKTKDISDIMIDGRKFDMENGKFYRLPANDVRGLFLGQMTNCCQSIGGVGAECAEHGFTSENGGFYVLENAKGKIVAQTWAWRGEKGELVFDSLETLGQNVTSRQWQKLTEAFAAALAAKPGNVTAFHIGTGGKTPDRLKKAFNKAVSAKPLDYKGYRDSHGQLTVWQKTSSRKP